VANQRNIEAIDTGRKAIMVAGAIRDAVDEQMRVNITLLIAMYRSGSIDRDLLVGKVAECAALVDLLEGLESKALQGDIASQREFGHAKTS